MSPTKVIVTYKRKRLSSCSGVGHSEAYDEHEDATKGRLESHEQDLKFLKFVNCDNVDNPVNCKSCLEPYNVKCAESSFEDVCHAEKSPPTCSSPQVQKSSISREPNFDGESDAINKRKTVGGLYELPKDSRIETLNEDISREMANTRKSVMKDVDSCLPHVDEYTVGASVSHSVEKETDSPFSCNFETLKAKVTAPLLTFSRRMKRKADANSMSVLKSIREGSSTFKEEKSMCIHPCSCGVTSCYSRPGKESSDLKMISNDPRKRNVLCQSRDEMNKIETGECSSPCTRPCPEIETLNMGHNREKSYDKGLDVNTCPVTEPTAMMTLGSTASPFPDVEETRDILKENVPCPSNDGAAVSCSDGMGTTDDHVSHQLHVSNSESQPNRSSSCLNSISEKKASTGPFIIDCNVVPESEFQEQASDIVNHCSIMDKTHEDTSREGQHKSRGLELFGPTDVKDDKSLWQLPEDACASVAGETKPKVKCLQLFSEDAKSGLFSPTSTESDVLCSKSEQNATFLLGSEKDRLERSSTNASSFLGLSLPTEAVLAQTSKVAFIPPFQDQNIRPREFNQNSAVHPSFLDHASLVFRHRRLLESINTKATALRENRNISLDNLEPCPTLWTDDELDSLWIGIRRHGRGNWHAMLLDPRLHFAPWRVARDLALQWEQEQVKLLSGQQMLQSRFAKPPDLHSLERNVGFLCSGTGVLTENISADTRLSLGDVYAQNEGSYVGFTQPPKRTRRGSNKVGNCSYGMVSNLQGHVMIRGDGTPDGPVMGFAANNSFPHWLRETVLPHNTTLPQFGALAHPFQEHSGTVYESRNPINNSLSGIPCAGPSTRKQGMTDDPIVIDSDASSEETISDDHNIRS